MGSGPRVVFGEMLCGAPGRMLSAWVKKAVFAYL